MKKIFTKVMTVLAFATAGLTTASCGSEDILNTITQALSIWQMINQGQTTNYVGSAQLQKWDWNATAEGWEYEPETGVASVNNLTASLQVKSQQAAISLGSISVGGYKLDNINLSAVTYAEGKIGDVNDEGYVYGVSYSLNGGAAVSTSQDANGDLVFPYASVVGEVSDKGALTLNLTIIMDDNNAVNIVYNGTVQVQE